MISVRRRSSESKKPRSPSLRRIGVMRRRSREREAREAVAAIQHVATTAAERRSRSPGPPRRSPRSPAGGGRRVGTTTTPPAAKPALTPLNLDRPLVLVKGGGGRLQRGQPNSTSSGLEKPSPIVAVAVGADGQARPRIKMSFNNKGERPKMTLFNGTGVGSGVNADAAAEQPGSSSQRPAESTTPTTRGISHSDSIASLR